MKIDGVGFNKEWAWGKTQDEFVNEFKDMEHIYPETEDKVAKLKEAYNLLISGRPVDFKKTGTKVVPAGVPATTAKTAETGKPS